MCGFPFNAVVAALFVGIPMFLVLFGGFIALLIWGATRGPSEAQQLAARRDDPTFVPHGPGAILEWWPDYGGVLFWLRSGQGGSRVTMAEIGLSPSFQERATRWIAQYDDALLPGDGPGDGEWLAAGTQLLADARAELHPRFAVVVNEPYWGDSDR